MTMRTVRARSTRVLSALVAGALISACASAPRGSLHPSDPAGKVRPKAQSVAVAAATFDPEAKLQTLTQATRDKAAAAGAGSGAGDGLAAWVQGLQNMHCSGEFCGAALGLYVATLPVFMAVGAIVGGATEASHAQSTQELEHAERDMQAGVSRLDLQHAAQRAIADELSRSGFAWVVVLGAGNGPTSPGDIQLYPSVEADLLIEVAVLGLEIVRSSNQRGTVYAPLLRARGRLHHPAKGGVVDEVSFVWTGPYAPGQEWTKNNAGFFVAALNAGIHDIAEALSYELLLAWYPPHGTASSKRAEDLVPAYALKPIEPQVERGIDLRGAFSDHYKGGLGGLVYPYVKSVQPRLTWERFPRDFDGLAPAQVSQVTYDLRIYRAVPAGAVFTTGPLVYERRGIAEPSHRVEQALTPCQRYTWTVRAHFRLDGQPRATEWGNAANAWEGFPSAMEPREIRRNETPGMLQPRLDFRSFYYPFRAPTRGGSDACRD